MKFKIGDRVLVISRKNKGNRPGVIEQVDYASRTYYVRLDKPILPTPGRNSFPVGVLPLVPENCIYSPLDYSLKEIRRALREEGVE